MFDIGIKRLLDELPKIDGLDPDTIRRLLSGAFVDVISIKDLGETPEAAEHLASVRRLATVLELQAIFDGDFSSESTRACAFVAAEALELVRNLSDLADDAESDSIGAIPNIQYTCMEAASLYLIAGFDANAAVAARPIDPDSFGESDPAEAPAAAAMARSAKGPF
ncbi:MAG: hypothetical protein ACTHNP_09230 [Solirubrobacterales bacterium]